MIPHIGLGTGRFDDAEAAKAVFSALEMGYRHIDTAGMYGNERGVGEGIRRAGVPGANSFPPPRPGTAICASTTPSPPFG